MSAALKPHPEMDVVDTRERFAVHRARDAAGAIATQIVKTEPVRFEPPGFEIASLFAAA